MATTKQNGDLKRIALTVIGIVVAGLLVGGGSMVLDNRDRLTRLEASIEPKFQAIMGQLRELKDEKETD